MLEQVTLQFGEWLPDLMDLNNPGATEALNVIPTEAGYAPFKRIEPVEGLVLPETCKGAVSVITARGDQRLYAATANALYTQVGRKFVTSSTPFPFPVAENLLWQFVQFGDELVALHPEINPISANIYGGAAFITVGGRPPKAACGARIGDFLVLGNLDEVIDGRQPQRIRWGGFNRLDAPWGTDPLTQADFQDMPAEGGAVIGIAGREFGTVFQERIISRMTYVGLPAVFEIVTVEEGRGAMSVAGIIDVGAVIFFVSEDGFFQWNGVNSKPISSNKVNRYFFGRLNYGARGRIVGALDAENECIRWAFPVGTGTVLSEQLIYSYKENRWTHALVDTDYLMSASILGTSLDDLHDNLDNDYPISFDDPRYSRGRELLAGFDDNHNFGYFRGKALAPVLETAEATGEQGRRIWVASARPLVDATYGIASIRVGRRDQLVGEPLTYGPKVLQESNGECPVLEEARFMRFKLEVREGEAWQHAQGVEIWRKLGSRG